jgi:hypothetical protein
MALCEIQWEECLRLLTHGDAKVSPFVLSLSKDGRIYFEPSALLGAVILYSNQYVDTLKDVTLYRT